MDNRETDNPVDIGKVISAVSVVLKRVGRVPIALNYNGKGIYEIVTKDPDSSDKSRGAYNA